MQNNHYPDSKNAEFHHSVEVKSHTSKTTIIFEGKPITVERIANLNAMMYPAATPNSRLAMNAAFLSSLFSLSATSGHSHAQVQKIITETVADTIGGNPSVDTKTENAMLMNTRSFQVIVTYQEINAYSSGHYY
jgi:hypothetical protein